jgi:membrane-associated protease RseP (regulator of RpoE activity)
MHFVIALVLFWAVLLLIGTSKATLTLDSVGCVRVTTDQICAAGLPAPASDAGVQAGDTLVSYNGVPLKSWEKLSSAVAAGGFKPATLVVDRGGVRRAFTMTPAEAKDAKGKVLLGTDNKPAPKIGVSPVIDTTHYNVLTAVPETFVLFGETTKETVTGLGKLPTAISHLFDKGRSADNSPASVVGVGKIAGDAVAAGSFSDRAAGLLGIVASLNLFVGLFNLLPLLPLDGGHIAIVWFESLRSRLARLFRRPDPGRVDITKLTPALYAVFILIVGLSVTLIAADIVNPIANPF